MADPRKRPHSTLFTITEGHPARRFRPRPNKMDSMAVSHEQYQAVQTVVLDVFADCTNAGMTLQDTLAAIYITGMQHALETINA